MGFWGDLGNGIESVGNKLTGGLVDNIAGTGNYNSNSNYGPMNDDTEAARQLRNQFSSQYSNYQGGQAPTMQAATIATGPQDQARGLQQQAAASYQGVLDGTAPSLADLQAQKTLQQNQLASTAAAAGARGPNRALAFRAALDAASNANAGAGADAAIRRAAELNDARAGLASTGGAIRGQDQSLAGDQASLQQQAGANNQSSAVQTRSQDIADKQNLRSAALSSSGLPIQADQNQIDSRRNDRTEGKGNDSSVGSTIAGGLGAAASLFSDERVK